MEAMRGRCGADVEVGQRAASWGASATLMLTTMAALALLMMAQAGGRTLPAGRAGPEHGCEGAIARCQPTRFGSPMRAPVTSKWRKDDSSGDARTATSAADKSPSRKQTPERSSSPMPSSAESQNSRRRSATCRQQHRVGHQGRGGSGA